MDTRTNEERIRAATESIAESLKMIQWCFVSLTICVLSVLLISIFRH